MNKCKRCGTNDFKVIDKCAVLYCNKCGGMTKSIKNDVALDVIVDGSQTFKKCS